MIPNAPNSSPLTMIPLPRASVPTALPMASVAPPRVRHRFAGQRQRCDEPVLEAQEEHEEPDDADGQPVAGDGHDADADEQGADPGERAAQLAEPVGERGDARARREFGGAESHRHHTDPTGRHVEGIAEPASGDDEHRDPGEREECRPADDEPGPTGHRRPASEIAQGAVGMELVDGEGGRVPGRRRGQHEGDDEGGDERTGSERHERAAPAEPVDQHGDDRGPDAASPKPTRSRRCRSTAPATGSRPGG